MAIWYYTVRGMGSVRVLVSLFFMVNIEKISYFIKNIPHTIPCNVFFNTKAFVHRVILFLYRLEHVINILWCLDFATVFYDLLQYHTCSRTVTETRWVCIWTCIYVAAVKVVLHAHSWPVYCRHEKCPLVIESERVMQQSACGGTSPDERLWRVLSGLDQCNGP